MGAAGVWTVAEIIRRPSLLASLRHEVHEAISSLDPPNLNSLLHLPPTQFVTALPRINDAYQETLRFHSTTVSLRLVEEDILLPAALCRNNTGLSLKKGDELMCVTRVNQVDNEGDWGRDADQWDPERFTDGKRRRGTMSPFGGGASMVSAPIVFRQRIADCFSVRRYSEVRI